MMLKPEIYRGIEYVQVQYLPINQRTLILSNISSVELIKIKMSDDTIIADAIYYKSYAEWYSKIYLVAKANEQAAVLEQPNKVQEFKLSVAR